MYIHDIFNTSQHQERKRSSDIIGVMSRAATD